MKQHTLSYQNLTLAIGLWLGLTGFFLVCIACQSSVRITPGTIEGTHRHTITTIAPAGEPSSPKVLHVHIQPQEAFK